MYVPDKNFKTPRQGCVDATLAYHDVWLQVLVNRKDQTKNVQILNKVEYSLSDAVCRDYNRMQSEPGESLRDWLLRLGWLEVRDGVTVPIEAPAGCNSKCFKCTMYDDCVLHMKKEA